MFTWSKQATCIFLFTLCATAFGEPIQYDLLSLCNSTIDTFSSALLNIDSWWWIRRDTCTVGVKAVHSYDNRVRLEVLDLQALCGYYSMKLYDGMGETARQISPELCDDRWKSEGMYLTNTDTLTIILTALPVSEYYDNIVVSLLATSTSSAYQFGDFECKNYLNVIEGLKCDGYNNCGDMSDETEDLCNHWRMPTAGIVGASVSGVLLIVAVVLIVRWRLRRSTHERLGQPAAKENNTPAPLPYGSVQ